MDIDAMSEAHLRALNAALALAIAAGEAAERAGLPFAAALDADDEAATITFSVEVQQ